MFQIGDKVVWIHVDDETGRRLNDLVVVRGGRLWPKTAPRQKQRWYYLVQLSSGETANAWEDELHRIAGKPLGGGLIR